MPVPWHPGKRDFFKKKTNFFAECLSCGTRQRVFKKKFKNLSRLLHSGKKIKKKKKKKTTSANGVKSSPNASTALAKAFTKCTIFDTRERRLSRGRISRRLFPECCTRGRLPRVQLALGESSSSCSAYYGWPDSVVSKSPKLKLTAKQCTFLQLFLATFILTCSTCTKKKNQNQTCLF